MNWENLTRASLERRIERLERIVATLTDNKDLSLDPNLRHYMQELQDWFAMKGQCHDNDR